MLNTLEFLKERERDLIIQRNTIERDLQYVARLIYISEGLSNDSNFINDFIKKYNLPDCTFKDELVKQLNSRFKELPLNVIFVACNSLIGSGYKENNFIYNLLEDKADKLFLNFCRECITMSMPMYIYDENLYTFALYDEGKLLSIYKRSDHKFVGLVLDKLYTDQTLRTRFYLNSTPKKSKILKNKLNRFLESEEFN